MPCITCGSLTQLADHLEVNRVANVKETPIMTLLFFRPGQVVGEGVSSTQFAEEMANASGESQSIDD